MDVFEQAKAIATPEVFAAFFPGQELRRDGQILATLCIFHLEKTPSLKLYKNGFKCFGCGAKGSNIDLLIMSGLAKTPLEAVQLIGSRFGIKFTDKKSREGIEGSKNDETVEQLTVAKLAEWKKLPEKLLRDAGLKDSKHGVLIPYWTVPGELGSVRYRRNTDTFRWASGSRIFLYGLDRLTTIKKLGWSFLVEGESDCWTAWHYDQPCLGVPGKTTWKPEWANDLAGITLY